MGNNHNQYFGKDKRKIIVLGLQAAGKTTLVNYLVHQKVSFNTQKTKNLQIQDKKIQNLNISFFDLGGAQRQRIFWKQQYEGAQGVIFVIDSQTYQNDKKTIYEQLNKLNKNLDESIPFCIGLSKIDKSGVLATKVKSDVLKQIQSVRKKSKVFQIDYKVKTSIQQGINWFLKQTKPI